VRIIIFSGFKIIIFRFLALDLLPCILLLKKTAPNTSSEVVYYTVLLHCHIIKSFTVNDNSMCNDIHMCKLFFLLLILLFIHLCVRFSCVFNYNYYFSMSLSHQTSCSLPYYYCSVINDTEASPGAARNLKCTFNEMYGGSF